ncbi:MAG: hypothetical protein K9L28_00690 [Synergistales bacterium]|nr:hypothetical protein [Synergistales bacterium]
MGVLETEETTFQRGIWILAKTSRGEELALVAGPLNNEQIEKYKKKNKEEQKNGSSRGNDPQLQDVEFVRLADEHDLDIRSSTAAEEDEALLKAREILRSHNLDMKLVDVEFLFHKKKMFLYFTSEQRVDFRSYVRDLAREFRTRIELRQIGVRDEAKVGGGLGPCGMPCCCSYWLNRFSPICIRMVKEQNLALNPTKISGICGRLMCCMGFEHDMYHRLWEQLPNPGSKVRGPQKTYVLAGVDIHTHTVRIVSNEGKHLELPITSFEEFREAVKNGTDDAFLDRLAPASLPSSSERNVEQAMHPSPSPPRGTAQQKEQGGRKDSKRNQRDSRSAKDTGASSKESKSQEEQRNQTSTKKKSKKRRRRRPKKKQGSETTGGAANTQEKAKQGSSNKDNKEKKDQSQQKGSAKNQSNAPSKRKKRRGSGSSRGGRTNQAPRQNTADKTSSSASHGKE